MAQGNGLIKGISVGLALVLIHAFLWFNLPALFPGEEAKYRGIISLYIVAMAFIFAFDARSSKRTESPLFQASFFSSSGLLKLIAGFAGALLLLIPLGLLIKGDALPSIYTAVTTVGIGTILLHAFIVSFDEELIFRGFVTNELQSSKVTKTAVAITQSLLFAAFHWYSSGGDFVVLSLYVPLGFIFLAVRNKFSPKTQMANIGAHFGWNFFILGFIRAAGG